jgi:5-methylcytosine-specific restriction endonuclease McrA
MEKQRFGDTRENIMSKKGAKCARCGSTKDLQIDHKAGGGRHMTEQGMMNENTHKLSNLQILCAHCMGVKDRARGLAGMGTPGTEGS